jgi:hypothetical protein
MVAAQQHRPFGGEFWLERLPARFDCDALLRRWGNGLTKTGDGQAPEVTDVEGVILGNHELTPQGEVLERQVSAAA